MRTSAAILLMLHCVLLAWGAFQHSPTFCESGHLAAGVSHWEFGNLELYRVNPPLVRLIASIPALVVGANSDWTYFKDVKERPEIIVGSSFMSANGGRAFRLIALARCMCIPFALLGAFICWRWSTEAYGSGAGIAALAMWCFCPETIAHGQLITPDMGATALGMTAAYSFWRWLIVPSWRGAFTGGVVLGLAQLSRTYWLVLFALWPMLAVLYMYSTTDACRTARWVRFLQVGVMLVIGLFTLNIGYGCHGTGTRLDDYTFSSHLMGGESSAHDAQNRFRKSYAAALPVPLPFQYVLGIDEQRKDFESFSYPSYLRCALRERGWWYFYVYGMMVKVPCGILALSFASCAYWNHRTALMRSSDIVVLAHMMSMLVLVSSQTGFTIHFRYVLPVVSFGLIWASRVVAANNGSRRLAVAAAIVCIVWSAVRSTSVYPHCLSYFNEAVGGPIRGELHMVYSAHDWGQDVLYLKRWMSEHPEASKMKVKCYVSFDLRLAGIEPIPPPTVAQIKRGELSGAQIDEGWFAISTTVLQGIPWQAPQHAFAYFREFRPVDMVGYSIRIFHLNEDDARRAVEWCNHTHIP